MTIDATGGKLLEGFEKVLGTVMVPALRNQSVIGPLCDYVLNHLNVPYHI